MGWVSGLEASLSLTSSSSTRQQQFHTCFGRSAPTARRGKQAIMTAQMKRICAVEECIVAASRFVTCEMGGRRTKRRGSADIQVQKNWQ